MGSPIVLPSGAELVVGLAPFEDGNELFMAFTDELKSIKFDKDTELDIYFFKDLMLHGFSSKKIEAAMWKCMARTTYDKLKITKSTFEPEKARQDYVMVCVEVLRENLFPFVSGLYAQSREMFSAMPKESPK